MTKRPNILFLMTDQQRFDTFSHVNPKIHTPNLDALIKESVLFQNARCTNPSCVPSRAAIMTGKYPSECASPMFITPLPKEETTFMKRLKDNGYYTAVIGKQHFAGSEIDRGYDYEDIVDAHGTFAEDKYMGSYLDYLKENGVDPKSVSHDDYISCAHWDTETKYHIDYYIGQRGKEWIQERGKSEDDKPWFFTLSFPGPHHPYDGEGTEYENLYDLKDMEAEEIDPNDLGTKPPQYSGMDIYSHIYLKDFSKEAFAKTKRSYYANMSLIDQKVGEMIEELKRTGMYDNTIIIYTSDHGDFMGDHGLVEKLQCLSDSLMRVPLFVKPPVKDFKGIEIQDPVLNHDIASTCLEIAGIEIPKELSNYSYNGYWSDLYTIKKRNSIYMESGTIKGVIVDNVKVVHYMDRPYGELYDLNIDPMEKINLWEDSKYDLYKIKAYQEMMNSMYRATPNWDVPWNIGTPEI